MLSSLTLIFALQQAAIAPTTPPSGDTVGYWQQEVRYRIAARLDETREMLVARGELTYVNNSPDALTELYVHQHLNAFRPASAWSVADEREGRERFQSLADPAHAYERFTAAPRVAMPGASSAANPVAVTVEYPGSPDSTVARLPLPRPLAPGDSMRVYFEWEARPSTLPRRQGRRGRHYDFAQWYPRVAVYDRLGWRYNPLVPAGEFYGEFGTYDVSIVVRDDQVIGATGVAIEGDPGWQRALRWGEVHGQSNAHPTAGEPLPIDVPAGHRRVRFHAQNVHHFGWSTSPDYRYEGGAYVRQHSAGPVPFRTWDTVGVHVLYQPGDEESWGNGQVVQRTAAALRWLESIFGTYAYPQITALHRIEGGGTEFPMVMMNGSPSQGLILHELGHVFVHGILANNEWASGWIDEGFSSYQTAWSQGATAQDRGTPSAPQFGEPEGYRGRAVLPTPIEAGEIGQYELQLTGEAEPIGTASHEFNEFGIYNQMIYSRASTMFGQLRDLLGDERFREMLRNWYRRWGLKHVDELSLRTEAERVYGQDLDWFFRQWIHDTGVIDYALTDVQIERAGTDWVTRARVERIADFLHPMPVGVRTSAGWTIVRADARPEEQWVEIRTDAEPLEVRLDPQRTTDDWDRRNDVAPPGVLAQVLRGGAHRRIVVDWPFLRQVDRDREVVALAPLAWYSEQGGLTLGVRQRSSYQGWIDRSAAGVAAPLGGWDSGQLPGIDDARLIGERVQFWAQGENPTIGSRVLNGFRYGVAALDGIAAGELGMTWDLSRFLFAPVARRTLGIDVRLAGPITDGFLPEQWENADTYEGRITFGIRTPGAARFELEASLGGGLAVEDFGSTSESDAYPRLELSVTHLRTARRGRAATFLRLYAGFADGAPAQRQLYLSSDDPFDLFGNHWWRPRDAVLDRDWVNFVPLGGGGLRGYSPYLAAERLVAFNVEQAFRLLTFAPRQPGLGVWVSAFADVGRAGDIGFGFDGDALADAGLGLSLRGFVFDRDIRLRVDFPIYIDHPQLALDDGASERVGFRWGFALADFW